MSKIFRSAQLVPKISTSTVVRRLVEQNMKSERKAQAWQKPKEKWNRLLHAFFRPKATTNVSTISAPLPIHAPKVSSGAFLTEDNAEPQSLPSTVALEQHDLAPPHVILHIVSSIICCLCTYKLLNSTYSFVVLECISQKT